MLSAVAVAAVLAVPASAQSPGGNAKSFGAKVPYSTFTCTQEFE
jgi:hypothetical protein